MLKQRLFTTIKILIFLVVCGWVGWELYKSWNKIQQVQWSPNYFLLTLSGICYVAAYIPAAIYWRYAMQMLGQQPGLYETFRAYYIGHLGKYVLGKAMVFIIRTGLLNHQRTKITAAGASVFLETMTMMMVGAFVAALIMLLWFRQIEQGKWLMLLAFGTTAGTMLPILPPVFHFIAKQCRIELEGLTFKTLAIGWMLYIPLWMMLGVSLWLTILGFGIKSESVLIELPFCTMAISLSVVAGFMSMIPGGFGVREFALVHMLVLFFTTHPIGAADPTIFAIAVAAVQRMISVFAELVIAAMLSMKPKRPTPLQMERGVE